MNRITNKPGKFVAVFQISEAQLAWKRAQLFSVTADVV